MPLASLSEIPRSSTPGAALLGSTHQPLQVWVSWNEWISLSPGTVTLIYNHPHSCNCVSRWQWMNYFLSLSLPVVPWVLKIFLYLLLFFIPSTLPIPDGGARLLPQVNWRCRGECSAGENCHCFLFPWWQQRCNIPSLICFTLGHTLDYLAFLLLRQNNDQEATLRFNMRCLHFEIKKLMPTINAN